MKVIDYPVQNAIEEFKRGILKSVSLSNTEKAIIVIKFKEVEDLIKQLKEDIEE